MFTTDVESTYLTKSYISGCRVSKSQKRNGDDHDHIRRSRFSPDRGHRRHRPKHRCLRTAPRPNSARIWDLTSGDCREFSAQGQVRLLVLEFGIRRVGRCEYVKVGRSYDEDDNMIKRKNPITFWFQHLTV